MPTEISIYGDIGEAFWFSGITANDVRLALQELDTGAIEHVVHINSTGGRVDEGLAMMNTMRAHKEMMRLTNPNFKLRTVGDGYIMSAATLPFMAGDVREAALGSIAMIHDAWGWPQGNAAALRKEADNLDKVSDNAAGIFALLATPAAEGQPSRDKAYFRKLMSEESYFTGEEMVAAGIATKVDSSFDAVLFGGKDFTPENLKGHYIERMMQRKERHTYNKPIPSAALRERKEAITVLNRLAIELGQPLIQT